MILEIIVLLVLLALIFLSAQIWIYEIAFPDQMEELKTDVPDLEDEDVDLIPYIAMFVTLAALVAYIAFSAAVFT